jgi:adenylate cyclase
VNIRPKIILVVLPLIIVPLVLAGFVSYLSARNGITAVASGFLRFKSQTLVDYMEGQWTLLTDNNLETDPAYLSAAEGAMSAFAANLIRSDSEIILALDENGMIVMSSPEQDSRLGPYPDDTISGAAQATWRDTLVIGEERRVAHVDYFEPWGWTVLVTESWASFYRPVQRTALLIGLIGAASLALALLFLVVASGRITRPLESMVTVIDGVMETMDLSRRVEIYYTDETGKLGHSFNRMAGSLEKANADIKNFALRAVFAHRQAEQARRMEKGPPDPVRQVCPPERHRREHRTSGTESAGRPEPVRVGADVGYPRIHNNFRNHDT